MNGVYLLILAAGAMVGLLIFINYATQRHNLNSIKDKTVGNGQHGTARWATGQEVKRNSTTCLLHRKCGVRTPVKERTQQQTDSLCHRASYWDAKAERTPWHWWILMTSM